MSPESLARGSAELQAEKILYPFQDEIRESIQVARQNGAERTHIDVATGCGKTVVIAHDIKDFLEENPGKRILNLCHDSNILQQNAQTISEVTGIATHGRMFGGEFQDQEQLVFATFQTMGSKLGSGRVYEAYDPQEFDYIFCDESHHAPAPTYRPVIDYFQPDFMVGASATVERRDEQDINDIFGPPVYELKLEEAIAKGYLAKPDYHVLTDQLRQLDGFTGKLDGVSRKDLQEINGMVFVPKRDQEIADTITQHLEDVEDPRTLIFCASIGHTEHFSELLPGKSAALHSGIRPEEQTRLLKAFRSGEIPTLLVVDMFNEGVDVPEINSVVFLRSTESKTVFFQQLGRGLRKMPGKDSVTVLDFVANWDRLSTLRSLQSGISEYRKSSKPRQDWEIDTPDISFNFSPEAMEAVQVVQEAREREKHRQPAPKETPRLDKWEAEEADIKAMLGIKKLPEQKMESWEWKKYSDRLAAGDPEVEQELILRHLRLAYGHAKSFSKRINSNELTLEDHFQHAIEGVSAGIRRYDPSKHKSLKEQIGWGIYRVTTYRAKNRGLIKLSHGVYENLDKREKARKKLLGKLGGAALYPESFDGELSKISGLKPEVLRDLRWIEDTIEYEALLPVEALSAEPDEDTGRAPHDRTAALFTMEALKETLENLSYRERRVIELRYGLGGEHPRKIHEIGRVFGVTGARIGQIENQSLKKLKRLPEAQPLRSEESMDERIRRERRERTQDSEARNIEKKLQNIASRALKLESDRITVLKEISEHAPAHIVGLADSIMDTFLHVRHAHMDKTSLLIQTAQKLGFHPDSLSYNDYIKTLHLLEEHGLIQTTRNERGTIIESISLSSQH